jgi:rhodanese-related sulfurtransferase
VNVQILFLALVGLALLLSVARFLGSRSVPQYSPSEIAGRIARQDHPVLLDVRTERERAFEHIKGSLHIPLQQLRARAHELQSHRQREIVCYCQSGSRSLSAAAILQKHGYRAASLRGGIVDWNFNQRTS